MVATCAAFGSLNSCRNSPGLSFHRIPIANTENKLLRQRWIQNIHRADPLPKDENFYFCVNNFEKDCFQRDLKVRNFVSAYLTCILPAQRILKAVHQQSYRLESLQTSFPTCFNPWINNLPSATFYISALASLYFNPGINNLSYWSQFLDRQSFLSASILGQIILPQ